MRLSNIAATHSFHEILRVKRVGNGFILDMAGRNERSHWLATLKWTVRTMVGLVICTGLAFAAADAFSNHPWGVFLPFLFVIVIVAAAARYGVTVGILGSIISAAIFAHLLYAPLHSFRVEDESARAALAWMILGGIAIPYLMFPGLRSRAKSPNKK